MEETTSAQDMRLLDTAIGGARSGEALSQATNGLLSPEEAILRLKQLLHEDDILDAIEERRLFFWKARQFLSKAERDWDDGVKNSARVALDALKFASDFSRAESDLAGVQTRVTSAFAQIMVNAIQATLTEAAFTLAQSHSIELYEIQGVFQDALPAAVAQIEARTSQ